MRGKITSQRLIISHQTDIGNLKQILCQQKIDQFGRLQIGMDKLCIFSGPIRSDTYGTCGIKSQIQLTT